MYKLSTSRCTVNEAADKAVCYDHRVQEAEQANSPGAIYIEIPRERCKRGKAITRPRALMGKIYVITPSALRCKNSPQHRPCSKCGAELQTCLSLRARWMISHIKTGC